MSKVIMRALEEEVKKAKGERSEEYLEG